ncbi:hypothetical protein EDB87DRAFT_1576975 [Lactarius vividus]|nr:hypothetical protein EDB87DRAFT_1576975 [Lactarius vividus]
MAHGPSQRQSRSLPAIPHFLIVSGTYLALLRSLITTFGPMKRDEFPCPISRSTLVTAAGNLLIMARRCPNKYHTFQWANLCSDAPEYASLSFKLTVQMLKIIPRTFLENHSKRVPSFPLQPPLLSLLRSSWLGTHAGRTGGVLRGHRRGRHGWKWSASGVRLLSSLRIVKIEVARGSDWLSARRWRHHCGWQGWDRGESLRGGMEAGTARTASTTAQKKAPGVPPTTVMAPLPTITAVRGTSADTSFGHPTLSDTTTSLPLRHITVITEAIATAFAGGANVGLAYPCGNDNDTAMGSCDNGHMAVARAVATMTTRQPP